MFPGFDNIEAIAGMTDISYMMEDLIRANFLSLDIYYESTVVTTVREEPKFTPDTLMSSLGGALSLYLGISVLSMLEVLEVFWPLARRWINSMR